MLTLTASIKIKVVFDLAYKLRASKQTGKTTCRFAVSWIIKSHASTHTKLYVYFQLFLFSRARSLFLSHTQTHTRSFRFSVRFSILKQNRREKQKPHTRNEKNNHNNNNEYTCIQMPKHNSLYFTASVLISALPSSTSRIDLVMIESRMNKVQFVIHSVYT